MRHTSDQIKDYIQKQKFTVTKNTVNHYISSIISDLNKIMNIRQMGAIISDAVFIHFIQKSLDENTIRVRCLQRFKKIVSSAHY